MNRRHMIRSLALGSSMFPALVSELLARETAGTADNPLAPKAPHFPGTAKRVIMIYLSGGASHVDSFDPKPKLAEYQRENKTGENGRKLLGSPWPAKPHGQSGIEVTDLFPNIAESVDDLCIVRSMRGDHNDHFQATLGIHTGSVTFKRPSVGSWVTYGMGTENQNLPCYVVLAPQMPYCGRQCIVARRMMESGVRFVELIDVGSSNNWDAHGDIHTHAPLAKNIDKPIAGLLADLKSRGMLKDTLVVFTTEFGRSPGPEGDMGRGHYNRAYSSWLAGGGVKGGITYGKSDEFGAKIAEKECHVHD